jgi:hypothetical protein
MQKCRATGSFEIFLAENLEHVRGDWLSRARWQKASFFRKDNLK